MVETPTSATETRFQELVGVVHSFLLWTNVT